MEATGCQIQGAKGGTAARKGKERKKNNGKEGIKRRGKTKGKESVRELVEVKGEQSLVSKVGERKKMN